MFNNYFQLLRPSQWLKNIFIFLPVFFDGHLQESSYLWPTLVVFAAFCMAASGIYCFNDIFDANADRMHPVKSKRPIASGAVGRIEALLLMSVCFILSIVVIYLYRWPSFAAFLRVVGVVISYIMLNVAYCVKLKQIAIVDIFIIATGFVLRIFAGGFATGINLSHWIILMTFLLALFLAFAKRRDDVVIYEDTGVLARKNVNRYNLDFMNQAITIVASITMVCYILYTVSPEVIERFDSPYVYVTSVFVLAGIIRYLQLTIVDVRSGSPTKVLMKDLFVQICIAGWLGMFFVIIYF